MSIVKGGHAIMLEVQISEEIKSEAKIWCDKNPNKRTLCQDFHLTVLFIGRNLDASVGKKMQAVFPYCIISCPVQVETKGYFEMMGWSMDHLVVPVHVEPLKTMRQTLEHQFPQRIKDFGFNPHITVAKGIPHDTVPDTIFQTKMLPITAVLLKTGKAIERISFK